jgi:hypothetical protein
MDTDDSGKPFIGVVGPSKTQNRFDKYLYPVVCFYKEKKIRPAQVFLVKDDTHLGPKLAIGALPRVNREFKECSYARFTIT